MTTVILTPIDETFDVGLDTRTAVDDSYKLSFRFTGTTDKLTFNLGPEKLSAADKRPRRRHSPEPMTRQE